jgi:hypothetical protein
MATRSVQATALAQKIQTRIADLDFQEPTADSTMRVAFLEDIHRRLASGELDVSEAKERLDAGKSVFTNGAGAEPEEIQPLPVIPFPVDSLPSEYQSFVKAVATGTLTDTDTAGAAVLGGVSAIVGTRIHVRVSSSWCYHSGLYIALFAPSSYGKSSVIESVDQPIRLLERELREAKAESVKRSRSDVIYTQARIKAKTSELVAAQKKKAESGAASDLANEIAALEEDLKAAKADAVLPALVADDFTVEAVVDVLELNDERVTVTSSDTGIFNVERYNSNPSIELLLKCWKGEAHREIRRGRADDADLQKPSMAMLVATQIENVKALATGNPSLVTRGLLPRFLPVIPEDRIGSRDVRGSILGGRGIDRHLQDTYNSRLIELNHAIQKHPSGVVECQLDEDARIAFTDCCQAYENSMGPGGELRSIMEAAGKFPLQLMKLCGINWAMDATTTDKPKAAITALHVARASAQMTYFIQQQHKLYDALAQAPADALATKLRGWCRTRRGQMLTSYNMRKSASRNAPIAIFHEALDILEDEGVVRVETLKTAGRPSIRVHIL